MKKLSVIIPTFNEEQYLEGAIRSVLFADEIIVIDSFSTDSTKAIAERYNCIVLERKFDNFSNQKNHALQYAKGEWVLFLDADERITYILKQRLLEAIHTYKYKGYKLKFPHFYMNRFLYHHYAYVTRLVLTSACHFEGSVHEKLIVKGNVAKINSPVLHYTYMGLMHYISKKNKYAWFQAEQMHKKQKKTSYFQLVFKPFYRFFHNYIIKRAFLDGVPGFAVSVINAYGVFSRYAKLILIEKQLK